MDKLEEEDKLVSVQMKGGHTFQCRTMMKVMHHHDGIKNPCMYHHSMVTVFLVIIIDTKLWTVEEDMIVPSML